MSILPQRSLQDDEVQSSLLENLEGEHRIVLASDVKARKRLYYVLKIEKYGSYHGNFEIVRVGQTKVVSQSLFAAIRRYAED